MNSTEVRGLFLDFFRQKGHQIVPSAPLVVKNDPSLMFTNAGMNQFKDWFLGNSPARFARVADTQKCLRVSGKHNDLEEVGIDTYHHTMFEMLGNWSFGNAAVTDGTKPYFKKEAIDWAWELLTTMYRLSPDRLYATVFGGDKVDDLAADEDARRHWKAILPVDRILDGTRKDNFWEMGETGPCGPCSEIHIDLRADVERQSTPGHSLVNQNHPLVIEIWNLVFIEFNRKADGVLEKLPAQHVDTGMGFERLCMAIQGKTSTYDTDVFTPLMDFVSNSARVRYGDDKRKDVAIRVLADHVRAVAFAVADGQLPSNTGAGYVIRRILRRAVRYAYSSLGFKEPFLCKLVDVLARQLGGVFPELSEQREYVSRVIREEEDSFLHTLERGLRRFDAIAKDQKKKVIPGSLAFELYDTFGFPPDLTNLIARERGLQVDLAGFEKEMVKQKSRSRSDAARETGDWVTLSANAKNAFVGYDQLEADVRLTRYREVTQKNATWYQLVFDKTPFYAESGGQVGDTGLLVAADEKIPILDTRKENELTVHLARKLPRDPAGKFHAVVDTRRRTLIMNNHSATHLLHAALRQVLGAHVEQRGSLVSDTVLRFDFSHFAAMTPGEISDVEHLVNVKIRGNIHRDEQRQVPLAEAKKMGAMALFGEKYGDLVRVITFDPAFSVELCGGTHVPATGQIGLFKIISESSIAAGIRRIEAVTADEAEHHINRELQTLSDIRLLLKNPKDAIAATKNLLEEKHALEKKMAGLNREESGRVKEMLAGKVVQSNGRRSIIEKVELPDADTLKGLVRELRNELPDALVVIAADIAGKPQIAVGVGATLVEKGIYDAGAIVRELAADIDGGGGGQPFLAIAGGKNLKGLEVVLEKARELAKKDP